MRKAQSISINTIIVAVLALLVLIVIALIFSGKIRIFGGESRKCTNLGGQCQSRECTSNEATIPNTDCTTTQNCCMPLTNT